jgi:hypothetical protein
LSYFDCFQRARAAFWAIARFSSAESFLARAFPPSRPNALAASLMVRRFVVTAAY